ncbi:MAG: flavin reductase family protein [Firmicutes bacterium]|nr:flavin reductase family protein [Bacillota bacterium]
MKRVEFPIEELLIRPCLLFGEGMVLAAGDFAAGRFNAMAIGWGSIGRVWGKPFAQVFVRPTRYTYEFMEKYNTFTIAAFPSNCRKAIDLLGTKSGREMDKVIAAGLTPEPSLRVAAPSFAEAELVIECRKIYFQDLNPAYFLADYIAPHYGRDYHRLYFGEILAVTGVKKYRHAE